MIVGFPQLKKASNLMNGIFSYRLFRGKNKFARPNDDTVTYGERFLRSFGPIIWNEMLPEKLKLCPNLLSFKESIKEWTPTNCRCVLCKDYVKELGYVNITDY